MFKDKEDEILNLGIQSINIYEYKGKDYGNKQRLDKKAFDEMILIQ